jgi:hypothetical protein
MNYENMTHFMHYHILYEDRLAKRQQEKKRAEMHPKTNDKVPTTEVRNFLVCCR